MEEASSSCNLVNEQVPNLASLLSCVSGLHLHLPSTSPQQCRNIVWWLTMVEGNDGSLLWGMLPAPVGCATSIGSQRLMKVN